MAPWPLCVTLIWLENPPDRLTTMDTQIMQYVQVLLVLGGVLALAYVSLRVGLPRMFGMRISSSGPIQILARYPLEPKKTLYLVKTGSQVFLIGTSESQVAYLTAMAPENMQEILAAVPADQSPRKDFRQIWAGLKRTEGRDEPNRPGY